MSPTVIEFPVPMLGFAAYSGTGKTTLLLRLPPLLERIELRIAVIKHAHHACEIVQARTERCFSRMIRISSP